MPYSLYLAPCDFHVPKTKNLLARVSFRNAAIQSSVLKVLKGVLKNDFQAWWQLWNVCIKS
jgi:hypothetical protein